MQKCAGVQGCGNGATGTTAQQDAESFEKLGCGVTIGKFENISIFLSFMKFELEFTFLE